MLRPILKRSRASVLMRPGILRGLSHLLSAALAGATAEMLHAQTTAPLIELGPPRFRTNADEVELHRVRHAVVLAGGRVAVADAGNHRVVILTPQGRAERTVGRLGSGPGDFRSVDLLSTRGDTLFAYDAMLARVSKFDGKLRAIHSAQLPLHEGRPTTLRAFTDGGSVVVTSTAAHFRQPTGLLLNRVTVLSVPSDSPPRILSTVDWSYSYHYAERTSSTTYAVPFLGNAFLFRSGDGFTLVKLASNDVEIRDSSFKLLGIISVPARRLSFDRSHIDGYRDSLLKRIGNAASPAYARVATVFGPSFPVPRDRPVFTDGASVGRAVWLRLAVAGQPEMSEWLIVSTPRRVVSARVLLPRSSRVLGGSDDVVVVLERDDSGAETIALYRAPAI